MGHAAERGKNDNDPQMTDKDIQDIMRCIDYIKKLNMFTAMNVKIISLSNVSQQAVLSKFTLIPLVASLYVTNTLSVRT